MSRWTKVGLGVAVVGVLLLGAAVGGVVDRARAQPGSEEDKALPRQEFLSRVAARLGVSEEQLREAVRSTELEMLDEAVQQGRIPSERADRLRQRIEEGRLLPPLPRPAPRQERLGPGQRLVLRATAEALGVTPAELVREVRDSGKSLAQLAEEKGISREELKSRILDDVQKHVDKGLERLRDNIDRLIDRTWGATPGAANN